MKTRAGILAEILILLALAVPAKAEGIFSLQIGYYDYPYYGGYYNYWPDHSWYGYWPYFYSPVYFGNYYPFYYPFYPSYYSYFYYRPYVPFYSSYWCYPWYSCPYYSHYRHDRSGHHHHDRYSSHNRHYSHDRHSSREPYRSYDRLQPRRSFQPEHDATGRNREYRAARNDGRTPVTSFRNNRVPVREPGNPAFNYSGRNKPDVRSGDKKVSMLSRQQFRQAPMVSSPSVHDTTRVLRSTKHTAMPSYTAPARKRTHTVVHPAAPGRGPAHVRQIPQQQSFVGKLSGNRPSSPAYRHLSSGRTDKYTAVVPPRQNALAQPGRRTDYAQAQTSPRQYRGHDHRQPSARDSGKGGRRAHQQRDSRE